ncbi:type ISP restriction/modification enzyme [Nannocystis bainbridge]|uniref:site-specific DNA-methyltransferase (adenine-specific) n=1 Tax=Nannocystis bainbridge TaxID=2995303 RepID=A0ABT5E6S4_9BACT|nr:type ISP restriction/modification enzyme [Nannocystis bainbridge]MDC0721044.1 N-6 DNA methylase [Nannocystis bainbridge]
MRRQAPKSSREVAARLAASCRTLRDALLAAVTAPGSRLRTLADAWSPATRGGEAEFAEALAQTITYGLWSDRLAHPEARAEVAGACTRLGETPGPLLRAMRAAAEHRGEIGAALDELEATVAAIEDASLAGLREGEGTYFYEEFLAAYDARLRREAGAYYTPAEVVHAQIVAVRELLQRELAAPLGFAAPNVTVIDPACGTGVYPLAIVDDALRTARAGGGDVEACMTRLGESLVAHEVLAGPHAAAHARVTRALRDAGGRVQASRVMLRDTLARPQLEATDAGQIRVCIGNPPYDRRELTEDDRGGWIRHGDPGRGERALLGDFLPEGALGRHAKNLYNAYVYFWRWALWWSCEQDGPGIVCLITPSSYLRGPGFAAMRRHLREVLDALWILDLGGDALGPRRSANVFKGVRTPVCIAVGLRRAEIQRSRAAVLWYARLADSQQREEKLLALGALQSWHSLEWARAADAWEAPLVPGASGDHGDWPRLIDLFPWQHAGAQWKRTWPIAVTPEVLERRWRGLLRAEDRAAAFRESEAWTIARPGADLLDGSPLPPLASLPVDAPMPRVARISWRSLDRRWCLADARLGDRLRPALWRAHGPSQLYLTTLLSSGLSRGPAVMGCAEVPDLHHFRGSFGDKGVIPLWRDAMARQANVTRGLLDVLGDMFSRTVAAEELFAYVYGCLGHPGYVDALAEEVAEPGPRVPLTRDERLFSRCAAVGAELLGLHTFRAVPTAGAARCVAPVREVPAKSSWTAGVLSVGSGRFAPVAAEIWGYEVSGLKVVSSWLAGRMLEPRGRTSSPLDAVRPIVWSEAMTQELLELLWVLERSWELHRVQAEIFAQIVAGEKVPASELPTPTASERSEPRG